MRKRVRDREKERVRDRYKERVRDREKERVRESVCVCVKKRIEVKDGGRKGVYERDNVFKER